MPPNSPQVVEKRTRSQSFLCGTIEERVQPNWNQPSFFSIVKQSKTFPKMELNWIVGPEPSGNFQKLHLHLIGLSNSAIEFLTINLTFHLKNNWITFNWIEIKWFEMSWDWFACDCVAEFQHRTSYEWTKFYCIGFNISV